MNGARRFATRSFAARVTGLAWRSAILLVALLTTAGASAKGFAIDDLTPIGDAAAAALGPGYIFRAEPRRVSLYCPECTGAPMVDILLGTQTDGTEERVRSGATTMAHMERLCRAKNDGCRITALDVAPAVGWVSHYPRPSGEGSTAVIIRDGQLLTLRVIAGGTGTATEVIERLLPLAQEKVIGR
ncbi:MAG: hypothetical protein EDM03_09500 [Porphyrobacter sp. IPPAS B-1204]|nr:MAG: hypothetical protein EDM03_09500 [Porphyrobacter sp. IPPAS B-1204]